MFLCTVAATLGPVSTKGRRKALLFLATALWALGVTTATAEEGRTWRIEIDNDIVFNSDNQLSNAWSVQLHGPPVEHWEDVRGTPAFGKRVARWFLPREHPGLFFREGWAVGQTIQTPTDLENREPIVDDVPYAASLAAVNSWVAFNNRDFYGVGWMIGVLGPAAGGEEIQRPIHTLIRSPDPKGWGNQIGNHLLLNIYYERRRKIWQGPSFDLTGAGGIQLGNGVTGADVALELRVGRRRPGGFAYTPDLIGLRLSHHAQRAPEARSAFYASLVVRGSAIAHYVFIDEAADLYAVERKNVVGGWIVGLHYQRKKWGLHLNGWLTTDTIEPGSASEDTDTTNDIGTLMFEFRP